MKRNFFILIFVLSLSGAAAAQPSASAPKLSNAKLITRAATSLQADVNAIVASGQTAWIAYAAPVVAGEHHMCCFNSSDNFGAACCGGCRLENERGGNFIGRTENCNLEPGTDFYVFLRAEQGQIVSVRSFSSDCGIDAGGMPVTLLTGVKLSESVALLSALADRASSREDRHNRVLDGAISALAFHAAPEADAALDKLVAAGKPLRVREKAAFWLGNIRGQHGLQTLLSLMKNDSDDSFRDKAVFAISQSREPQAEPALIRIAREDQSSRVRGQAIFWLAQKAGKKVAGVITDAVENDPDTSVKKKAVFALTQMPSEEGVPLLIQVAKNNRNPMVRKEAVFWLGQSHDPRALDFIENVLTH